jgi:hypothetical protein
MSQHRTWTIHLLAPAEDYRSGEATGLSVTITEDACPLVIDNEGCEVRDHGSADWPSITELEAEASHLIGADVMLRNPDAGDSSLETIYSVYLRG